MGRGRAAKRLAWADLSGPQQVALRHPCLLAEETAHPRYGRRQAGGASVVLTVNSGYE